MGVQDARQWFLTRIKKQLDDQGQSLDGLELQYWKALGPEDESEVEELWKQKSLRKNLDAAEKVFERALKDAIRHDLMVSATAQTQYLRALDEIKSLDGVQLQALVFGAAMEFKELTPETRGLRWLATAAILTLLGIGLWIGIQLRR